MFGTGFAEPGAAVLRRSLKDILKYIGLSPWLGATPFAHSASNPYIKESNLDMSSNPDSIKGHSV
jgi:hypothetical protein